MARKTVTNTYNLTDCINPAKHGISLEDFQIFCFANVSEGFRGKAHLQLIEKCAMIFVKSQNCRVVIEVLIGVQCVDLIWKPIEVNYLIGRLVLYPAADLDVVLQPEIKADEGLEDNVADESAQMCARKSHNKG